MAGNNKPNRTKINPFSFFLTICTNATIERITIIAIPGRTNWFMNTIKDIGRKLLPKKDAISETVKIKEIVKVAFARPFVVFILFRISPPPVA
ncbi:MAG: hypothetical protein Q8P86_00985 [bacterium]|nr:hypothetical protein [bacterium]